MRKLNTADEGLYLKDVMTDNTVLNFKASVGIGGVTSGLTDHYNQMESFSKEKINIALAESGRENSVRDIKMRAERLRFEADLLDNYAGALESFYLDYAASQCKDDHSK